VDETHSSPPRPLTDLVSAIGFLTLLPVGRAWPDDRPPRSVGWYPWVGWLLGGLALGVAYAAGLLATPGSNAATHAFVVAAVIMALWAFMTRFLHWDGLADAFDGLWGGATPERRLEIMRDSRIGSFGAAAMLMTAIVQVACLTGLLADHRLWALLAAPVLGRFAAALSAWTMPSARREGLGLTAMERPGFYDVAVASLALIALIGAVSIADPMRGPAVVLIGLAAGVLVPRMLAQPVRGMTGDLFGATVLVVETLVLLVSAVV